MVTLGGSRLAGAPARRGGGLVLLVLGALVLVNLYVFVWDKHTSVAAIKREAASKAPPGSDAAAGIPAAAVPSAPLVEADNRSWFAGRARRGFAAGQAAVTAAAGRPSADAIAQQPVGPPGVVEDKVTKTDTLGRLLKRSGLTAAETDEVIRALTGSLDFRTIRAGQTFRIERGPDGRVKKFELVMSKILRVTAERQPTGELKGSADAKATKVETKAVGGKVASSLYAAVKATGETGSLVDFFVDVFAYDLDFNNDTNAGDTFRVLVEKESAEAQFLRYRRILAAEYAGKAGTFKTYWWNDGYYTAAGESAEKTLLKTPLKFFRVSSGFDKKRMHPILHIARAHLGVDYAAPVGTPVWAAASGTVVTAALSGGAGNLVSIRHEGGIETAYMHLSKFAPGLRVGQKVAAKTIIGYVGTTGLSTGPHLHFGVKQNGVYIDPTKLQPIHGRHVPAKQQAEFDAEVARLDGLLGAATI